MPHPRMIRHWETSSKVDRARWLLWAHEDAIREDFVRGLGRPGWMTTEAFLQLDSRERAVAVVTAYQELGIRWRGWRCPSMFECWATVVMGQIVNAELGLPSPKVH